MKLSILFDFDSSDDAGADPYYFDSALIHDINPPLYSYVEIFHGEDWKNANEGERSLVCQLSFDGTIGMFWWRNLQFSLEDVIKFDVLGCYIYEPSEDLIHARIDMNWTISVGTDSSENDLGIMMTGLGDVDAWDGWLADSEGSAY